MDADLIGFLLNIGILAFVLIGAMFIGSYLERKHFESIVEREKMLAGLLALNIETLPSNWAVHKSGLVSGSVVVSLDYFKRVVSGIKSIFGGNLEPYESLLERARREAMLRMKADARAQGFDTIINVRLESASLSNNRPDGKGIAGVEVLAFGTGLLRDQ